MTRDLLARSSGEAAGIEEGLLFGHSRAAEHCVAVREPAEAANDAGMLAGILEQILVAERAAERHAPLLVRQVLGMHERQIEELPFRHRTLPVEAARDGAVGNRTRKRVGGKSARLAAEHVARELVEYDDQGKCADRGLLP